MYSLVVSSPSLLCGGGGQGTGSLREAEEEEMAGSGIPKIAGTGRNRKTFINIA